MERTPRAIVLDPNDGGLAIARRLARRHVPVAILTNASDSWMGHSRHVQGVELPNLAGGEETWLQRIAEFAGDGDGDGVLIPCSDRACALVAERRAEIPESLLSFESLESAHLPLMDKASLYEIAAEADVRHPWWRMLAPGDDLDEVAADVAFPCLLKPVLSHEWRRHFGLDRVFLIDSPELLEARARPALELGLELILTEHVPGPETNLEAHVAIRLADGTYVLDYTRRKLRQYPLGFGASSTVVIEPAPLSRALSRRLLDAAGFVGIASLETKLHADTGEAVLIEVNVRVPHDLGLGDAAGADSSHRLYRAVAGLEVEMPPPAARDGVKCVVPALEARAARESLRRGDVRPGALLASYRGVRECGVLDVRDPGPAFALARRLVGSRMHREPR